jgi:multidrug efflux pump subunit AcrB
VNVPIPGEQDAVDTAVQNGGILALVIVVVCVGLFAGWLWRSMAVRVAGALVLGGTLVYLVTKGS